VDEKANDPPQPLFKIGEFSEQGRGLPITASRPGPALPFSPLVRNAYAPSPRSRLGWAQGIIAVGEVPLDPPLAVLPTDSLSAAAARMQQDDSDFAPVVAPDGRFLGVVYIEELLRCVADDRRPADLVGLTSEQIPTCTPDSALVDAVRQMVACYLRRIPVVGDAGELLGLLTLSGAASAAERDPTVRDVLEDAADSQAFFARRWQ
jgi:CBS domain-containing protein